MTSAIRELDSQTTDAMYEMCAAEAAADEATAKAKQLRAEARKARTKYEGLSNQVFAEMHATT